MALLDKILSWDRLPEWRAALRRQRICLVVTNGCFDLIHRGHVTYLERARALGDMLLVGLNSDRSVRSLKGEHRPVNSEEDRAAVVAALESVNAVCLFEDRSALNFLRRALPDVYVKGGDYTLDSIEQDERRAVEALGGRVEVLPLVPGRSTTAILDRMAGL